MVQSVDNHLITQFSDMVQVQAQQSTTRLRPWVQVKSISGDIFAYDGIDSVEAQQADGRNVKIEFSDIEHLRRKIKRNRFYVALPIDKKDVEGMLLNPESMYARAVVMAMNRKMDKVIADAAFADVQTGRDFDTTVTYLNDGGLTVNATAGLTYEKMLEIQENFINNEVGNDMPERFSFSYSGTDNTQLMGETELTSGDFTRQFAVEKGTMTQALDFSLIRFAGSKTGGITVDNPILSESGTTRDCMAMSDRAICLGISRDMSIVIEPRPDLLDTTQVVITGVWGAVRTEGPLIQKVTTTF
jgi:hypothetical protein